jgi:hypothetical protein
MAVIHPVLLAALALVARFMAPAAVTLDGSFDRTVLKPDFTGSTCALEVNGNECGVIQLTGLGAADYIYRRTFEPNGTRGCFVIDGTFTLRLQSDGSTISAR